MERIFIKIHSSQVRYREPYFVKCCRCGLIISGRSVEEVYKKANERGWKYDYRHDVVFCSDCITGRLIEEAIQEQKEEE